MEPIITNNNNDKVFFIIGASSGIGLSVTKQFINAGYKIAATSRSKDNLLKVFNIHDESRFLALENDLLDDKKIKATIDQVYQHFGRIDVVFSNAGFGIAGVTEEISDENLRSLFDINFFASASVLRHVTEYLVKGSHVFMVSSFGGFHPIPSNSAYNATKFAMDGLSESYAEEVEDLGIKVTIINSGSFASSFGSGMKPAARDLKEKYSAIYKKTYELVNNLEYKDPTKFAEIVLEVTESASKAPLHLFIGPDANNFANIKIDRLVKELKENELLTTQRFLTPSV
ncbi:hypothetical protein CYY_003883 [Polysphondylium violaceum]|uniref:Uncharacterized protein n=1 Tax=Polysphondylium violaceum TaxID=133409 RepID=A0A8J4V8A2_9MYCE|nr:hypothetical protein CYY_003883 [Polysphondylium violaceum]